MSTETKKHYELSLFNRELIIVLKVLVEATNLEEVDLKVKEVLVELLVYDIIGVIVKELD